MNTEQKTLERIKRELSSTYYQWTITEKNYHKLSIIDFLQEKFPEIDPSTWQRRIEIGGSYINGQRLLKNQNLDVPCRVEYFMPKFDIYNLHNSFPVFEQKYILYEDNDLIIFFKPANFPSVPSRDQNIISIKKFFQEYVKTPIHMASRLDSDVSGIMVISKSSRMHPVIQRIFEHKQVEKIYILQVDEKVTWQNKDVENCIVQDPLHKVLRKVAPEGKKSHTCFTFIKHSRFCNRASSFLEARPVTGRTHQIRLHASHIGLPIIGDNFYNGAESDTLHLLSYRIKFWHEFLNKFIDICVPDNLLPKWMIQ